MRFKHRLRRLELVTKSSPGCECLPPGLESPVEVRVSEAYPGKPRPEPEPARCSRCGLPTVWIIKVRGLEQPTA